MIPALQDALIGSAANTLESMCFSVPECGAQPVPAELALAIAVRFEGDMAGTMRFGASPEAARELTAAFLGTDADEASPERTYSVLLELANIICGATLSSYHRDGHFRILAPQIVTSSVGQPQSDAACTLKLETGAVAAAITLEPRA